MGVLFGFKGAPWNIKYTLFTRQRERETERGERERELERDR